MRRFVRPAARRYRRVLAAVGIILTLLVLVLEAHAALPEHHHVHGTATMCLASLAIAALFAAAILLKRRVCTVAGHPPASAWVLPEPVFSSTSSMPARAGPSRSPVLRR